MPLESCTGGHRASKSSRNPKTMDWCPRKRPEMSETTSFDDAAIVVYRGSQGVEILPGPKTVDYSTRKRPEMPETTSFDDGARFVYPRSQGIKILPGPENRGL